MKHLLILALCILSSCGLFHNTPPDVVKGQLAAYEGVQNLEHNYTMLLTEMEFRWKELIIYIHNFAFQTKVEALDFSESDPRHQQALSELMAKRDVSIKDDHAKVDSIFNRWKKLGIKSHDSVKQLIEAVYNNISENPISVDNIATIIGKSQDLWKKIKDEIEE